MSSAPQAAAVQLSIVSVRPLLEVSKQQQTFFLLKFLKHSEKLKEIENQYPTLHVEDKDRLVLSV